MTSQRLVEEFAAWLWNRDTSHAALPGARVPDSYMNEAVLFLAGELGQRLQRAEFPEVIRERDQLRKRLESAEQVLMNRSGDA